MAMAVSPPRIGRTHASSAPRLIDLARPSRLSRRASPERPRILGLVPRLMADAGLSTAARQAGVTAAITTMTSTPLTATIGIHGAKENPLGRPSASVLWLRSGWLSN